MFCVGKKSNTHTLQELKTNITIAINEIDRVQLRRVARIIVKSFDKSIEINERRFLHLL